MPANELKAKFSRFIGHTLVYEELVVRPKEDLEGLNFEIAYFMYTFFTESDESENGWKKFKTITNWPSCKTQKYRNRKRKPFHQQSLVGNTELMILRESRGNCNDDLEIGKSLG